MKGNFSRFTFNRSKQYSGVLFQQGRVQLDADWNEQLDIATHLRRQAMVDLLGPSGAPVDGGGFAITVSGDAIRVGPGRFWLDGILVENPAEVAINSQPNLPGVVIPAGPDGSFEAGLYAAYLDVWERHITALEDPDLLEPALGGPDTGTRRQSLWQVKLEKLPSEDLGCPDLVGFEPTGTSPIPTLAARVVGATEDNRLYRVEVHHGGEAGGEATFKWSRDNGTVAARIDNPAQFEIDLTGQIDQDTANGFAAGQWIEVTDEDRVLRGEPGIFARLASIAGQTLTVEGWPEPQDVAPNLPNNPLVRRWESLPDTPIPADDGFIDLEGGLQIRFGDPGAVYRTGDYWLIPVRSGAGAIWPLDAATGEPLLAPPDGIEHHVAPLALVRLEDFDPQAAETGWSVVEPCRTVFRPLRELQGDKVSVSGDTMTGPLLIEEASLTVRAGGTTALKVNDFGRVGVGTDDPQAKLQVAGGALMPAEGNSEQAGILFPPDIFGGSGDRAWMRYFRRAVESTTLEIGIANDPDDHIALMPSGNVGIGVAVPRSKLDINGGIHVTRQNSTILYNDDNASGLPGNDGFRMRWESGFFGGNGDALVIEKTDGNQNDPDGGVAFVNTGQDGVVETAMSIRGNGRVGIKTDDPTSELEVNGGIRVTGGPGGVLLYNDEKATGNPGSDGFRIRYQGDFFGGNGDALVFEKTDGNNNDPDGGIAFVNTGTDGNPETSISILGNNRVGIKTKSPDSTLDVNGSISANNVNLLSDGRWKTNVRRLTGCLSQVERLRGVSFEWNREASLERQLPAGRHLGFVAQEVEAVLADLVVTTESGTKRLQYANLSAVLVEAIKELSERFRALEERIHAPGSEAPEVAS